MSAAHEKPSRGSRTDAGRVCIPEPHRSQEHTLPRGDPKMRAAASPAGSKTASISTPELPRCPRLYPRREQSPARWLSGQARLQPGAAPPAPSSALTLKRGAGGCHRRHHMIRYKTRQALLRGYTPQDKFNTRERSRSHWKNSWQGLSNRPLL